MPGAPRARAGSSASSLCRRTRISGIGRSGSDRTGRVPTVDLVGNVRVRVGALRHEMAEQILAGRRPALPAVTGRAAPVRQWPDCPLRCPPGHSDPAPDRIDRAPRGQHRGDRETPWSPAPARPDTVPSPPGREPLAQWLYRRGVDRAAAIDGSCWSDRRRGDHAQARAEPARWRRAALPGSVRRRRPGVGVDRVLHTRPAIVAPARGHATTLTSGPHRVSSWSLCWETPGRHRLSPRTSRDRYNPTSQGFPAWQARRPLPHFKAEETMGLLRTAAHTAVVPGRRHRYDERRNRMALAKDEQRTLDEIERRLRDENPRLFATTVRKFRSPPDKFWVAWLFFSGRSPS